MDSVFVLWFTDETSWSMPSRRILEGIYATEEAAIKDIPEWAAKRKYAEFKYGADGQSYVIERHEVKR